MIKNVKKLLCVLLCSVFVFGMAACGSDTAGSSQSSQADVSSVSAESSAVSAASAVSSAPAKESETYIFTDSTGREVELPRHITRAASAGPLGNIMIYGVKPDVLVGWSSAPAESAKKYIEEAYWDLPVYGKLYGNSDDFNREALMASEPQVIIDVGEWDEDYKADLDALQAQIGIPVILIEANLEETPAAYRTIGELLGEADRGEALAAYCEDTLNEASEKAASIPEADRKTVYYGESESGLKTILSGTIHSQIFELIGSEIVVDAGSAQIQKGGGTVSLEQVMAWDPDIIVFAKDSVFKAVSGDASWSALTAISGGSCYEVPTEPYNWLGYPPGPNRMIGIRWLGNLIYPEVFDYDIEQEVKNFYSLFYRYDLTGAEVSALLENSTFKAAQ